jgi:hypothetical protein
MRPKVARVGAYTDVHPTKHYVRGLKALAHARVDQLGLGELAAEQRHSNVERFMHAGGGRLRCPECLAHDLKSTLEPDAQDPSQWACPLCGLRVERAPGA